LFENSVVDNLSNKEQGPQQSAVVICIDNHGGVVVRNKEGHSLQTLPLHTRHTVTPAVTFIWHYNMFLLHFITVSLILF